MDKYSAHQQKIIKNYYRNQDDISLQRAQELVTELYLSEGKKREKVWDSLVSHLEKLGMKPEQVTKMRTDNKPELVAQFLQGKF